MRFLLLIIFYTCWISANAQVQFSSLKDIFDYADQHASTVQVAISDHKIASSRYNAAKTALLPSINASAGFNDNITLQPTLVPANLFDPRAPEGTFNEYTFGRKYVYSSGVQASWDIVNFQKFFDVKTAGAAAKLSKAGINVAKQEVYEQLAQTYFSIILTKKYLAYNEENVAAADSINRIAIEKLKVGLFSDENVNRSSIQLSQAKQQLSNTKYTLLQLHNQLSGLLNIDGDVTVTDTISGITVMPSVELEAFLTNPKVLAEAAKLELEESKLRQVSAARYPVLTLGYQLNQSWATDDMFNLNNANNLPQQFWGVRFTLPVFNGFAANQSVKQARLQRDQQAIVLENRKRTFEKEDMNLRLQYLQSIEELKGQQDILRLQQINDQHSKDRYETGVAGLDERLQRFQELLQAQGQYMDRLSSYYICYYKIHIRSMLHASNFNIHDHNTAR